MSYTRKILFAEFFDASEMNKSIATIIASKMSTGAFPSGISCNKVSNISTEGFSKGYKKVGN